MPYRITQCCLPPGRRDIPAFTPAEAGTRLSDSGGMQGWVDLVCRCVCWSAPSAVLNGWTNRDTVREVGSGGPREPCNKWGPRPRQKQFFGGRGSPARPIVKYRVPDYRRWCVYDRIPCQVEQRAGDRGITAENMKKSQHTDFNEDTTNESASVACSSVRLWDGHS